MFGVDSQAPQKQPLSPGSRKVDLGLSGDQENLTALAAVMVSVPEALCPPCLTLSGLGVGAGAGTIVQ